MRIQLSEKRIVPDAVTIWSEAGDEVDLTMDLKNLTFKHGSIDEIYAFHVLDQLFSKEGQAAMKNWHRVLKPGGKLFIVVDNFEYVTRGYIGGDISIDLLNTIHNHATQFDETSLMDYFLKAGFVEGAVTVWFERVNNLFDKKHYELVLQGKK